MPISTMSSSSSSKLAADLAAALHDPEICDITLQGNEVDGKQVPASRFLLSARSKVFRALLFAATKAETTSIVATTVTKVLQEDTDNGDNANGIAATATANPDTTTAPTTAATIKALLAPTAPVDPPDATTTTATATAATVQDAVVEAATIVETRSGDWKESSPFFAPSTISTATTTVIPLNYSSTTLERIVHYCYTDEVREPLDDCSEQKVRDMVRLRWAALYFELPDLGEKIIKIICNHMARFPSLACVVLDEESTLTLTTTSTTKGGVDIDVLSDIALGIIGLRAEDSLLPSTNTAEDDDDEEEEEDSQEGGVCALRATALERVWNSAVMGAADNFVKFRSLQGWCGELEDNGCKTTTTTKQNQDERYVVAKELAKSIDFTLIKASDLAGITGSKLITKDQLIEAFKAHALSAEKDQGASSSSLSRDVFARHKGGGGGSVIVTGAGVPEVNGIYCEDGKCDGVMQYTKEGKWEGESGKYMLYRAKGNPSKKRHWFMDWEEVNLFVSELDESGMVGIPQSTWKSNNLSSLPPMPRVLFVPPSKDDANI
jgi:hypothetical protein